MCNHNFCVKVKEELNKRTKRVDKIYKCCACGAEIVKKGVRFKERYQQIDLNSNKVI